MMSPQLAYYHKNKERINAERARARAEEAGEHLRELERNRYANDPEKARNKVKAQRASMNPEVRKEVYRRHSLKSKYGITIEEFDLLLEKQNYCCAICKTDTPGGRGNFHVDHNHETGVVRGLLCHLCNVALHKAESKGWLDEAKKYLDATISGVQWV